VTRLNATQRLHLGARRIDLGEYSPGPCHEELAGLGQGNPSRGALNKRESDLVFEATNLLRERGLSDVLTRGRAREVPLLGERE
jgi:hypothetical protein